MVPRPFLSGEPLSPNPTSSGTIADLVEGRVFFARTANALVLVMQTNCCRSCVLCGRFEGRPVTFRTKRFAPIEPGRASTVHDTMKCMYYC